MADTRGGDGPEPSAFERAQHYTLRTVRGWAFNHPKAKIQLREGWAMARAGARRLGAPRLLEPPEFADLRRLAAPTPPPPADGALTVLVLSMRGWSVHVAIEAVVARALAGRGCRPVFATCGGRLPICDVVPVPTAPPMPCRSCAGYVRDALAAAGFDHVELRDLVDFAALARLLAPAVAAVGSVRECETFTYQDLPVGAFVRTSVVWSTSRATLDDADPLVLQTYKQFLTSGAILAEAFGALLDRVQPDRVFALNGSFFAERILAELATARDIPVIRYEKGFFDSSVIVSRWRRDRSLVHPGDTAWDEAHHRPLSEAELAQVDSYLAGRTVGKDVRFGQVWQVADDDRAAVTDALALRADRPVVCAFTNVLWDSATQDQDRVFAGLSDWLTGAVAWAADRPDLDLVIRIHPSELTMRHHVSREPVALRIAERYPTLPGNVRLVSPDSHLSTYTLAGMTRVGLVYTSTIGLEMACNGVPVLVAGEPHYAGRGFTTDPTSAAAYWSAADAALATPPTDDERAATIELARRYVHLFFFRFHQRLDGIVDEPGPGQVRVLARSARDLAPGADAVVDRIADAVIDLPDVLVSP